MATINSAHLSSGPIGASLDVFWQGGAICIEIPGYPEEFLVELSPQEAAFIASGLVNKVQNAAQHISDAVKILPEAGE